MVPEFSKKLRGDLAWGYFGFAVLGISGLLMNLVVAKMLGESGLGVFNQSFSVYIIASQLAVGGVHYSMLREASVDGAAPDRVAGNLRACLLCAFFLGLGIASALLMAAEPAERWFGSEEVGRSLPIVAIAVVLFAANKVLLACLNGSGRMRAFSILQSLRYLVIVLALAYLGGRKVPYSELSLCFVAGEAAVFLLAAFRLRELIFLRSSLPLFRSMSGHLRFGLRSFATGLLTELNTRVDILILGLYLADAEVGAYTLPAIVAEGAYQALIVVRNQINPRIAAFFGSGRPDEVRLLFLAARKYVVIGFGVIVAGGLLLLYLILEFYLGSRSTMLQMQVAAILMTGMWLASAFIPFDNAILYSGSPGRQSLYNLAIVLTNIIGNFLLVPSFGLVGAAAATALASAAAVVYLDWFLRKRAGISLVFREKP